MKLTWHKIGGKIIPKEDVPVLVKLGPSMVSHALTIGNFTGKRWHVHYTPMDRYIGFMEKYGAYWAYIPGVNCWDGTGGRNLYNGLTAELDIIKKESGRDIRKEVAIEMRREKAEHALQIR